MEKDGSANFTSFGDKLHLVDPSLQYEALVKEFFWILRMPAGHNDWTRMSLGLNIGLNGVEKKVNSR